MRDLYKAAMAATFVAAISVSVLPQAAKAGHLPDRIGELEGDWVATLVGNTGCGINSLLVTFHLDATGSGTGTATVHGHSTGCKDTHLTGQDFGIITMDGRGFGTACMSCGDTCGWKFHFQMNRENDVMTLTDVTGANRINTPTGTAIKQ